MTARFLNTHLAVICCAKLDSAGFLRLLSSFQYSIRCWLCDLAFSYSFEAYVSSFWIRSTFSELMSHVSSPSFLPGIIPRVVLQCNSTSFFLQRVLARIFYDSLELFEIVGSISHSLSPGSESLTSLTSLHFSERCQGRLHKGVSILGFIHTYRRNKRTGKKDPASGSKNQFVAQLHLFSVLTFL